MGLLVWCLVTDVPRAEQRSMLQIVKEETPRRASRARASAAAQRVAVCWIPQPMRRGLPMVTKRLELSYMGRMQEKIEKTHLTLLQSASLPGRRPGKREL